MDGFDVYKRLTVCPICARELEIHPCAGTKSCFLHGDFIVIDRDGAVTVTFKLMRWTFEGTSNG